jgi:hypothetical protein
MSSHRHPGCAIDRRRFVIGAGALASAGLADLALPATAEAHGRPKRGVRPAPDPIRGGIELAPGQVIHTFAPGDPSVTLPFTGGTLQGLDVEPGTIRNFKGSSAVAFHVGTARGHDGTLFNLETDMRAFEGTYVVDGETHRGAFAFV